MQAIHFSKVPSTNTLPTWALLLITHSCQRPGSTVINSRDALGIIRCVCFQDYGLLLNTKVYF